MALSALVCLVLSATALGAATVALDYPNSLVGGATGEGGMFRYRISNTNFDHSIANGGVIPPSTWVASRNLGFHTDLNNATWDFTLDYVTGVGYTFTLQYVGGGTPSVTTSVLSWTSIVGGVPPTRPFNAIELYAQVQNSSTSYTSATIDVTNLNFVGAGLSIDPLHNSLRNLHDDKTIAPGPGGNDLDLEWIKADVDLALFSWSLTGRVVASFNGYTSGNIDERIKFNIKTLLVEPAVQVDNTTWGRIKTLMR
jgi:hypothetical protein